MNKSVLTNLQLQKIDQETNRILDICHTLDPMILEDAEKIVRYHEILNYFNDLLNESYKKAQISERGMRLVV